MRALEFDQPPAAGCILYAEDTGRWGLQQRSDSVTDPGVWSTWGGGREPGETLKQTVRRELAEESGYHGPLTLIELDRNAGYVTYMARVPKEFQPRPNSEVKDWCWVDTGNWPQPLHPKLQKTVGLLQEQRAPETKLVIFDIDDTLVNTDTRVNVIKDGKVIHRLNSHDFTHYQLKPGEEFDFGAFRDAQEFYDNARPIAPMIKQLRDDIATGNRVIMVTARADFDDRDVFLNTFRKYGVDMDRVHVYRAGNIGLKVPTEEKKRMIIRRVMGQDHYDKVIMYDDALPNLQAFLSLASEYPWSRFYAWHVDHDGTATEYHRSHTPKQSMDENFADGRVKGKSRPGRVKRAGASCAGSVTDLRARAKKYGGERGKMYHWCANMKSGKKK